MEKITLVWKDNERTIILITYHQDGWGWEEMYVAVQQQKAMIESVGHPKVDVIVDTRKSHLTPKGGSLLTGIRKIGAERHPRQGHTVVVGARGLVRVMANVVEKMLGEYRQAFHVVDTMEQADALLARIAAQRDQTLAKR